MAYKFDKTVLGAAAYGGLLGAVWFDQAIVGLVGLGFFYSVLKRWAPESLARMGLIYGLFLGLVMTALAMKRIIPGDALYWAVGTPAGFCIGGLLIDILDDVVLRIRRRSGRRAQLMAPRGRKQDKGPTKKAWSNKLLKKTLEAKAEPEKPEIASEPKAPPPAAEVEPAILPVSETAAVEATTEALDIANAGPVSADDEEIDDLMDRARIGDLLACHRLGRIYELRDDGGQDYRKAFDWYRKGAREGDPNCCVELARFYEEGISVAADDSEACYWFLMAAETLPAARHGVQRIAGRLPHATLSRVRKRVKTY